MAPTVTDLTFVPCISSILKHFKMYCLICTQKWSLQQVRVKASSPSVNTDGND